MKKLTKAQKVLYPEFVLYADFKASNPSGSVKYLTMKSKNILEAMREAEEYIKENWQHLYLLDILGKSEQETELGEPLYETKLMTRVHDSGWGKADSSNWHFRDEEHSESSGDNLYEFWAYTHTDNQMYFHSKKEQK